MKRYLAFGNLLSILALSLICLSVYHLTGSLNVILLVPLLSVYYVVFLHRQISMDEAGVSFKLGFEKKYVRYDAIEAIKEEKWRSKMDKSTFLREAHVLYVDSCQCIGIEHTYYTRKKAIQISNDILNKRKSEVNHGHNH